MKTTRKLKWLIALVALLALTLAIGFGQASEVKAMKVEVSDVTYSRSDLKNSVIVSVKDTDEADIEGYTSKFYNNDTGTEVTEVTKSGDYYVIISADGYEDAKASFKVKPATITATLKETEQVYDGEPKTASDLVNVECAVTLGESDYTIEEADGKTIQDAGTYSINVTSANTNFEVTGTPLTYTIKPATITATLKETDQLYNREEKIPADLVNIECAVTLEESDYTIEEETGKKIQDAGSYSIIVTAVNTNFEVVGSPLSYTINKAKITEINLARDSKTYNREETKPDALKITDGIKTDSGITLIDGEYSFVEKESKALKDAGTYTIVISELNENFEDSDQKEATFTIEKAKIDTFKINSTGRTYHKDVTIEANDLHDTVSAPSKDEDGGAITLDLVYPDEYTLKSSGTLHDADTYDISVVLPANSNFSYDGTMLEYVIDPAPIKTITLGKNTSVYNRKTVPVTIDEMQTTLIAVGDDDKGAQAEFEVPTSSYSLKEADGKELIDVDTYTIQPVLNDKNYTDKDSGGAEIEVIDQYTITPASLKELKLDPNELIYRKEGYDPEKDLKDSDSKASVTAIGNGEDDVFDVPLEDVVLSCDKTILDVGTYTITATPVTENYVKETTRNTELTIKLMQVDPIVITVNGMQGLVGGENRLGGPNEGQYHSFSLSGEPNEPMTVTVSGDTGTIVILKVVSGDVITIKNNAITFEGSTLNLDTTGDVMYTITANYDDASNLKVGDAETAAAPVSETFYYDVSCKPGTVTAELMNRGETGISIDAAEDYSSVELQASGENSFSASASNVPAGGNHIPFAAGTNTKLFSTEHNGGNTYGGTFTDLLGNTANIDGQTIGRSNGTLSINSVDPAPNENGWISKTNNLNWSISMSATGGFDELTIFSIGGHTEHPILKQGDNSVPVDPNSLTTDAKLPITISFDDLNGNATYQSIGYDKQADMPLLTTIVYDGCNILGGIAEPGMSVTISVNGESVTVRSDRWGFFVTDQLPLAYEGDVISIHYVDKAGNYVNKTLIVGEAQDPVKMDAYMLGKLYSNSHFVEDSANAKWVNILNVSMEDLQNGRVTMPIIAGNIVKVGEIEFSMDANNKISYTYTLNDGINQLGDEIVMVDTKRNMDALMHLQGETISRDGTIVEAKGKNPTYSLIAKFEVEVPADLLQETFQTANENDNALKRMYVERQTQRSLEDSE